MAALVGHILKTQKHSSFIRSVTRRTIDTSFFSSLHEPTFKITPLSQGSCTEGVCGFDEMVTGKERKYYMLGGKGGVGKTSCAASLAVRFANHGHPTMVVSTDPAHSLSDSFAQDLRGGRLVPVEGVESPLYALEINPEKSMEEFRAASQKLGDGTGVKSLMQSMGLGMIADQLGDLKLEELLSTPPPGTDEIVAISKVMQFLESQEYNMFSRIVFDTAPTGHTLRLLSLPDFMDGSVGKLMKLKKKMGSAFKSLLGKEPQNDGPDKLEKLKERVEKIRDLFQDSDTTEFIIVTIPTVMAISESSRLHASLKKEKISVKRLIVNQVLPPTSDCKFCSMRRKDQMRAIEMIHNDSELGGLRLCQAPLVDMEIRGVPALKYMGDKLWR
ncbi:ATPase ASNA1 homolog 2 isoform X2 [Arachis ipaensis]|uniref:ATPase ASNA1 homolog 2 isoform X2 n=1 Tax=Arachis ipaensis TaxID=130454 RepID=UPI0007AF6AA4|nr:ATPase ASNA1 homolog 2 isoform X2 [Arachis ipaensis]XP_025641734.1 ATPase ARSA1 isoform X2 [Arachis hypogaea]